MSKGLGALVESGGLVLPQDLSTLMPSGDEEIESWEQKSYGWGVDRELRGPE